ncbi:unnamed protein product [Darwinula stevensoni]|uniref:STAS domain-containing protein n=1 Tax=Darwinula stevensoni TaxID=69355 RepID=A0A7R8XDR0_9CRUS|nr:unnamed protein product [Darwinula stevensoni]CAG0893743.1 unnamed protein product [Darwinula stevensoni]
MTSAAMPPRGERRAFTQLDLNQDFLYHPSPTSTISVTTTAKFLFSQCRCTWEKTQTMLYSLFPILYWLPRYKVKQDLLPDIIAGCTVAIMHIPQGMGYALLANVPPVQGIYLAVFPVLIYVIMGTSRHASMGSFAVVCLMTGKVVAQFQDELNKVNPVPGDSNFTSSKDEELIHAHHAIQIASALALSMGLFQVLMGIFQMGRLTVFLSDTLVSAFTTGAAVHVMTSQMKLIFGLPLPRHYGLSIIVQTYRDLFPMLPQTNVADLIASLVTMLALILNNELIKPWLGKRCPVPLPMELICVVVGTGVSYGTNLTAKYNVSTVGYIPPGLPNPVVPPMWLMGNMDFLLQSAITAIMAYATAYSMAILLARRGGYQILPNQEFLAQGAGNVFGGMFQCPPLGASLARSLVLEGVGGKTLLATLVSCVLLFFILLFLAPLFSTLPKSVLAGIIVISLKGLFSQFRDLKKAWLVSKLEAVVWMTTFLSVVLIDIVYGLAIGVAASLTTLIWRDQRAYACVLGHIPNTGIFVDVRRYYLENKNGEEAVNISRNLEEEGEEETVWQLPFRHLIFDFTGVNFVDASGIAVLTFLVAQYKDIGVDVYIAGAKEPQMEMFRRTAFFDTVPMAHFFPSVHDAVLHCTSIIQLEFPDGGLMTECSISESGSDSFPRPRKFDIMTSHGD